LETLRSHPFLKTRIALKGGTALNLAVLDLHGLAAGKLAALFGREASRKLVPELITEDPEERRIIASHPGLLWETLNVRMHTGPEPSGS